ncbi:MAG: PorT family protein, partial [Paludibacter sp.]
MCFLVATSHRVAAQEYHNDDKMLHFGFSLGFNSMDFGIESAGGYQADVSSLKPGFSVGIVSDLLINRYLNLRFTPTLHFAEREIS